MTETRTLSVSEIVAAVGGRARAAQLCNVSLDAIRKWREKNYIPPKNWPPLVGASGGTVTYHVLETLFVRHRKVAAQENEALSGDERDERCRRSDVARLALTVGDSER